MITLPRRLPARIAAALAGLALASASTALAAAEPDRFEVAGEIAKDTRTTLTWTRAPSAGAFTWISAINYCRTLRVGPASTGLTGWRLPTIKELQTLVDERATGLAIDAATFPGTPAAPFWSSSPSALDPAKAWAVHFATGLTMNAATTASYRVFCVKDAPR